jgi:hypothetical protein
MSSDDCKRTIVLGARSELDATYRVAVQYTLVHYLSPVLCEGEDFYEVTITAVKKKVPS